MFKPPEEHLEVLQLTISLIRDDYYHYPFYTYYLRVNATVEFLCTCASVIIYVGTCILVVFEADIQNHQFNCIACKHAYPYPLFIMNIYCPYLFIRCQQ